MKILGYIANVYAPFFVRINLHPRVTDGPENILICRDLMKAYGVPTKVKEIFISHAEKWLSPQNAAVVVHKAVPPVLLEDIKKIRKLAVNTRKLCWGKEQIKAFLTVESAAAPCITRGTPDFWRSVDCHNRTCERYVGKMAVVLKKRYVKDTTDITLDSKVRGYVLNMENEVEEKEEEQEN